MNIIKEFNSFGIEASGILPFCKNTKRFLIGLRSESVNEPDTWGNFGGAIGLNDMFEEEEALPPDENAIKELSEETGYNGNVELIDSFVFKKDGFTYYNYIGIVDEEFTPTLNWENNDFKWVTLQELMFHNDLHFGLQSLIKNATRQLLKLAK